MCYGFLVVMNFNMRQNRKWGLNWMLLVRWWNRWHVWSCGQVKSCTKRETKETRSALEPASWQNEALVEGEPLFINCNFCFWQSQRVSREAVYLEAQWKRVRKCLVHESHTRGEEQQRITLQVYKIKTGCFPVKCLSEPWNTWKLITSVNPCVKDAQKSIPTKAQEP